MWAALSAGSLGRWLVGWTAVTMAYCSVAMMVHSMVEMMAQWMVVVLAALRGFHGQDDG